MMYIRQRVCLKNYNVYGKKIVVVVIVLCEREYD